MTAKTEFQDVVAWINKNYHEQALRGKAFEKVVKHFLEHDKAQQAKIGQVWLWNDFPHRTTVDTGIDLVAEDKENEGKFWAIQAKFYDNNTKLNKEHVNSFMAASGKTIYCRRLIVTTASDITGNLLEQIQEQTIGCDTLTYNQLNQSLIDWDSYLNDKSQIYLPVNQPRPHQQEAITDVLTAFKNPEINRGKLIMACGTGKTFTSLKIAEQYAKAGDNILFLVPSISLLSQSLREWCSQTETLIMPFAVCSDSQVGMNDESQRITDLGFPVTTNAEKLASGMAKHNDGKTLNVIFSTYQSIDVICEAQKLGLPEFKLIICDEAHRTTGVEGKEQTGSHFVRVHDNQKLRAQKRLYMTATPRIYAPKAKTRAKAMDIDVYSMDDEATYGKELHRLNFSKAVEDELLSDYRVLIMAVDENYARSKFSDIATDDAAKLIGCWNGLRKYKLENHDSDTVPMRRAVAFANDIKTSKAVEDYFNRFTADKVSEVEGSNISGIKLTLEAWHVDGTQSAIRRDNALTWLRSDDIDSNSCRILTNARCLSEGVDVPALDAVMFLKPRKSEVDIVQSVGRVMRRAQGKEYGYIILPIPIKPEEDAEQALHNNDKYQVVWDVLQALRSHDDRFDIEINQMDLNKKLSEKIKIIGIGEGDGTDGTDSDRGDSSTDNIPEQFGFEYSWAKKFAEYHEAIFGKLVLKCGDRNYWENWSKDVAEIAERNIERLNSLLEGDNPEILAEFNRFIDNMQKTINPAIDKDEGVKLLSQHFITKPVFDALFDEYQFAQENPISQGLDKVVAKLEALDINKGFTEDAKSLEKFYQAVRKQVTGIDSADGKERIAITLYEKFFQKAFPKDATKMGVVYTPIEIVDYILHSADAALKAEFGLKLSDKDVHIIDPFTGTGTFISRLIKNPNLMPDGALYHKYKNELHANEILLLAYYLAAVNIENAYHGRLEEAFSEAGLVERPEVLGGSRPYDYQPFEGIILTDTFQLSENQKADTAKGGLDNSGISQINNERARRQNNLPIKVIIGNPPYSAGQTSQNDNNQNLKYPNLDYNIEQSYVKLSKATAKQKLYDSYIRSIRWASDKIANHDGIICFVSNGGFLDGSSTDGLRKSLYNEFSKIYIFNLRGDQRTSGEISRKEGGKVFGGGSRATVAITLLIKNQNHIGECELSYHDIGDYLSREEKLKILANAEHYQNLTWQNITPNEQGDWLNQRGGDFEKFLPLGSKEKGNEKTTIFKLYSLGAGTNRDAWAVNFSKNDLSTNMQNMIDFYNNQCKTYHALPIKPDINSFINNDSSKISWSSSLTDYCRRNLQTEFSDNKIYTSIYRPFSKAYLYFDNIMTHRVGRQPNIYPTQNAKNIIFTIAGVGAKGDFSVLIANQITILGFNEAGQDFPLYSYRSVEMADKQPDEECVNYDGQEFYRKCNITQDALQLFQTHYADTSITQEDIFYYCYGVLHAPDYRAKYAADLKRELAHIPYAPDFTAFMKAGRALAELHLNYETLPAYQGLTEHASGDNRQVMKMKFANKADKSTIIYNHHLTLSDIPLEAYDYVVNGKSAIEWIMDRYTTNPALAYKASGNQNNPNLYSDNPDYIINLLKSIITLSVESVRIVNGLPKAVEEET